MELEGKKKSYNLLYVLIMLITTVSGLVMDYDHFIIQSQNRIISSVIFICILFFVVFIYYLMEYEALNLDAVEQKFLFYLYEFGLLISFVVMKFNELFIPIGIMIYFVTVVTNKNFGMMATVYLSILFAMLCQKSVEEILFLVVFGGVVCALGPAIQSKKHDFNLFLIVLSLNLMIQVSCSFYFTNQVSVAQMGYTAATTIIFMVVITLFRNLPERMKENDEEQQLNKIKETADAVVEDMKAKAPSIFVHSQMVGVLASCAGSRLGLNADLLRYAALCHDVGKINTPMLYQDEYENEKELIEKHVLDGVAYAQANHFPDEITVFIQGHHNDLKTKEMAVLVLADAVEKSVRRLDSSKKSLRYIYEVIKMVIRQYSEAKKLDDTNLNMKELNMIIGEFTAVYKKLIMKKRKG